MACSVQDFFDDCPTKAEHLKGKIQEFLAEQCGPAGSGTSSNPQPLVHTRSCQSTHLLFHRAPKGSWLLVPSSDGVEKL